MNSKVKFILLSFMIFICMSITTVVLSKAIIMNNSNMLKTMVETTQVGSLENQINTLNMSHEEYHEYIQTSKVQLAEAISNKGVTTASDSTFETMVSNIENIITEELINNLIDKKLAGNTNAIGTVISYMGNNAPEGYLLCDGNIYNISQYPNLANQIKKEFGSYNYWGGDGTTTFAVPDLRGEFLRGAGTATRNSGSGASVGVHQEPTRIPNIYTRIDNSGNGLIWFCKSKLSNDNDTGPYNVDKDILETTLPIYEARVSLNGVNATENWGQNERIG